MTYRSVGIIAVCVVLSAAYWFTKDTEPRAHQSATAAGVATQPRHNYGLSLGTASAPPNVTKGPPQYRLEDTPGSPVIRILTTSLEPDRKKQALISTIRESGPATDAMSSFGSAFSSKLMNLHLISGWECHLAGCYFEITSQLDEIQVHRLLKTARRETDTNNTLILTGEAFPNKIAIVIPNTRRAGS